MHKSKYHNTRIRYDGRWFDSKRECEIYKRFAAALKGGAISNLELQKKYKFIIDGYEMKHFYRADFVVTYPNGDVEVWDAKGFKTKEYEIKKELMKAVYDIDIKEC
jgi:hypothetical protein